MLQIKAKIVRNEEIIGESWHCILEIPFNAKSITRSARPGQFINVKINNTVEPFLRRPFSIHKVEDRRIWIMYEILGKGTELLSERRPGEKLDIIGPLGNGFDLSLETIDSRQVILVAGGMGVAPLVFLAERLAKSKIKMLVLLGVTKSKYIVCENEFKKLGCKIYISTDDGSRGFRGKATDLLKNLLHASRTAGSRRILHSMEGTRYTLHATIYGCGPKPMLKEIAFLSKQFNIPAQLSLEEHMACGIGACLGCVVKTRADGGGSSDEFIYKRVCKEGPVFNAEEIIW